MGERIGEILVRALVEAGIERVYGLPGGENVGLLGEMKRQGLQFVLVTNESSAVYMADVDGRLNGRPGVCLTTLGPGIANAAAGVGHAYLDRAPVLIITAVKEPGHTHQYFDQVAFFEPITKGSFSLTADNVHEVAAEAIFLCQEGRPGPVHLQLNAGIVDDIALSFNGRSKSINLPMKTVVRDWERGQALWREAKRPLLLAGLGLEPERPYLELQSVAEQAGAPVVLTPKAKGALAADHPLFAGVIGLTRTDPVYRLIKEADCILAVGFDVVELVKHWENSAPLIWLASWQNEDPILPAAAEWVGRIGDGLASLREADGSDNKDWGIERIELFQVELAARKLPKPMAGRMLPQEVLTAVRANVPRDTIVTTDVGSHKILTSLEWPAYSPNTFFLSNGLSCMGFGLPGAISASMATGNKQVVTIIGDGGLGMVLGELNLVRSQGTPLIIVVMVDGALDLIRAKQIKIGENAFGTEFELPDFVKIAGAYGISGRRVSDVASCESAVREAVAAKRPMLIEAFIDPVSYPTTPLP